MTEKLTIADCFKYPNAEIIYTAKAGRRMGVKLDSFFSEMSAKYLLPNCKLILRDISQLTDEEKGICNSFNKNASLTKILFVGKSLLTDSSRDLTDYLRSIKIDIDNFIASGKAVKG